MIKKVIKSIFGMFGFDIKRSTHSSKRFSQEGCVANLKRIGFSPKIVIDGGGAYGDFSVMVSQYFPKSKYLIVEPLEEYKPVLEKNVLHINSKIFYKALSDSKGSIEINVHDDLVGTSLMNETEADNNGIKREVESITLDELLDENIETLVKLDLQGAEILALTGGIDKLKKSKNIVVMCESSLFQFYQSENIKIFDLIKFLEDIDYEVYDIYGASYRPIDNALAQIDLVFCHKESEFKKINSYADKEQRKRHNDNYKKKHVEMGFN